MYKEDPKAPLVSAPATGRDDVHDPGPPSTPDTGTCTGAATGTPPFRVHGPRPSASDADRGNAAHPAAFHRPVGRRRSAPAPGRPSTPEPAREDS